MAVYHAGHEEDCFAALSGSPVISTTAGLFDPDYSRSAIGCYNEVSRLNAMKIVLSTALAEGWLQFRLYGSSYSNGGVFVAGYTADDASTLFDLFQAGGSSNVSFQLRGATSDTARTAVSPSIPFTTAESGFFTVHWKAVSGGMLIEFFKNAALVSTATISNSYLNGKTVGIIRLGYNGLGASYRAWYSEIVVADEDTRGWRVATLFPNAVGTTSEWSGSYADIDEAVLDNADFISTDAANKVQLVGMSNLSIAAQNMDVVGVMQTAVARKGAVGPQNIQAAMRTNSVTTLTANLAGLVPDFNALRPTMWSNNPVTGVKFTVSEIQAIELGFKSIA